MKYLTIGEKQRPINFGWGGLELFEELTGINARDFKALENINLKQTRLLLYAGLVNGAETAGIEVDFKPEDLIEWINDDIKLVESGLEILVNSMPKVKKKKPTKMNPN